MPSARSNLLTIETKIRQLQEREAANGGLSESNAAFLEFLQQWKKFAGTDPIIVIQPKGALQRSGQPIPAKIISVTDQTAADLFAFAAKRQQLVRLATEDECKAYHDHVAAQQRSARSRAAAEKAAIANTQIAALLGHDSIPMAEPMPAHAAPAPLQVPFHAATPDASSLVPSNLGGAGASSGVATGGRGVDEVVGKGTAAKLVKGGITTLEQLAAASPEELVKLGIAASTAAGAIASAAEAIAPDDEGDSAGEE